MSASAMSGVRLVDCQGTTVKFTDAVFDLTSRGNTVKIAKDPEAYAIVTMNSHEVPYESRVAEEREQSIRRTGNIDYENYFTVVWDDSQSLPELAFRSPPQEVTRTYVKGQAIELGLGPETEYRMRYRDGVEATFTRLKKTTIGFEFAFSTGFYGSFWQDPDGTTTVRFKGDRLDVDEDALHSQSKFVVSRSKYTGNLLLILQDDATVSLR